MTAKKISHVGIAVPDIEQFLGVFKDALGLKFSGIEEVPDQQVRVAFLDLGESRIELLEPLSPDGPVGKFLTKNDGKPKFHHLAIEVDDVAAALARAKAAGVELIDDEPRCGAGGAKIAFLHPKSSAGVLTELCEHGTDHHK